jgi:hypothetical protein
MNALAKRSCPKLTERPEPLCSVGAKELAKARRGLTGADLKAMVEDGKLPFAHHYANRHPLPAVERGTFRILFRSSPGVAATSCAGSPLRRPSDQGFPIE